MTLAPFARIVSVQVGLPRELGSSPGTNGREQSWTSGIVKEPVRGPVWVGTTNLQGDGQADRVHHGGPDKAVLAYSADHYRSWQAEFGVRDLPFGAFGENLTVQGVTEHDVCIGDTWQAGDVLLQVSQPRKPCWKLGRRWGRSDLPKRVLQTGRSGWYLRVLRQGTIESGMPVRLQQRLHPRWTVSHVASTKYDKQADQQAVATLAELPELAADWREGFAAGRRER